LGSIFQLQGRLTILKISYREFWECRKVSDRWFKPSVFWKFTNGTL
jgi:hypothetical protein